jgi:hypothetical protein
MGLARAKMDATAFGAGNGYPPTAQSFAGQPDTPTLYGRPSQCGNRLG